MRYVEEVVRKLKEVMRIAVDKLSRRYSLPSPPNLELKVPEKKEFGDYTSNIAFQLARSFKLPPLKIAEKLKGELSSLLSAEEVEIVEVAGGGFLNFYLNPSCYRRGVLELIEEGGAYGSSNLGQGKKILVEFVSANPTGPLTVAHGRHAAFGDALARILEFSGYRVKREYYYNDSGRQMAILGLSTRARYLQLLGEKAELPQDGYQGGYILDLAKEIRDKYGAKWKEAKDNLDFFRRYSEERIFEGIRKDLADFGVHFDSFLREGSLYEHGEVERTLKILEEKGDIYRKDGALWFKTSAYGDEKDRVVVRENGEPTYLAPDIAYHKGKYDRGFHLLIDILGPDHHGYAPRLKAAVRALGYPEETLRIIILQLVTLYRGGERLPMSTRRGEFITLREVVEEVGRDATRFFFLMRRSSSHLDFDLEVAKKQSPENPVYYVQYAHARVSSIFQFAREEKVELKEPGQIDLERLREKEEINLMRILGRFPQAVEDAAINLEPQGLTVYLQNLASSFHNFYDKSRVVSEDEELTQARLFLAKAIGIVLRKGLSLLGVSAPEKM